MPKTTLTVPPKAEGTATVVDASIQKDLAARTWDRLRHLTDDADGLDDKAREAGLAILNAAFREANCHATLFNASLWELDNNRRIMAQDASGENILIVADILPPVGTIISWQGREYYIASHKAAANAGN